MNFIKEKLEAQGAIGYASSVTDTSNNQTWSNQWTYQISNVKADVANCRFSLHWHSVANGTPRDIEDSFALGLITDVQLETMDTELRQLDSANGHPTWVSQVSPTVWVLHLALKGSAGQDLNFTDQSLADRVAKAMAHAAELCGGLKPEVF